LCLHTAKIKESQATIKKLSNDCSQIKVDMHVLRNDNAVKTEEVNCLQSRVLEMKKDIAMATDEQQQLHVTKIKAEAGMCTWKTDISRSCGGESRKYGPRCCIEVM
jgi:chromosome segregation ATPase